MTQTIFLYWCNITKIGLKHKYRLYYILYMHGLIHKYNTLSRNSSYSLPLLGLLYVCLTFWNYLNLSYKATSLYKYETSNCISMDWSSKWVSGEPREQSSGYLAWSSWKLEDDVGLLETNLQTSKWLNNYRCSFVKERYYDIISFVRIQ